MPLNSELVKYVLGDADVLANMENIHALQPFDDGMVRYLDKVSRILLHRADAKQYPDVITFAFWCRRANMAKMRQPYENLAGRLGRGVVFHITPANVAVNFAYSLAVGLISGNANIVRLPSQNFLQVSIISEALREAIETADFSSLRNYICLIHYGHDQAVTDFLSNLCDARIIWGGDLTIAAIRQSHLKPRSNEITFADRYSVSVIESGSYLSSANKKSIAQGFFNDTYLTDQNACTSPRLVVWLGNQVQEAQKIFWHELHLVIRGKYILQPMQAVGKYLNFCKHAAQSGSVHYETYGDNSIIRVKLDELAATAMDHIGNSGYFLEYTAESLADILPVCTLHCQTLAYYGLSASEIRDFMLVNKPKGVDRIVPIGKTMDFSLVWDGCDLIRSLTREILSV